MKSFDRLVVPVNGSSAARRGIDFAVELAKREGAAARVPSVVDEIAVITVGIAAEGFCAKSGSRHPLVSCGTIERWFIGGVTLAMLRTSHFIAVHADDMLHAGPMLAAIDESSASLATLDGGIERARRVGATLALLHVFEERRVERCAQAIGLRSRDARRRTLTEAEDTVHEAADRARAAGLSCSTDKQFGRPGSTIVSAARRHASSSFAIGTHRRRELGRLPLGSGADEVVRMARVPVYVVHHHGNAASVTPSSEHSHARTSTVPAFGGPPRNKVRT